MSAMPPEAFWSIPPTDLLTRLKNNGAGADRN